MSGGQGWLLWLHWPGALMWLRCGAAIDFSHYSLAWGFLLHVRWGQPEGIREEVAEKCSKRNAGLGATGQRWGLC